VGVTPSPVQALGATLLRSSSLISRLPANERD
jgi:hypothetical protein